MKSQATWTAGFLSVPLALILVLATLPPGPSAAEFSPASRVTEITIYRDGALVGREARLTLPSGDHRVLLKEIPAVADPNSIRVTGTGTGGTSGSPSPWTPRTPLRASPPIPTSPGS